jgi:hypothetical protein
VEDYGNKYDGERVEFNGRILVPFRNIASIHCTPRCDAPASDWPSRSLGDASPDFES